MTILSSLYTSMTGLLSFSKALDVISDNVANLNTPGFKAGDFLFESLSSREQSREDMPGAEFDGLPGSGTAVRDGTRRFSQGEIRETGTGSHLAIDGQGFFILNDKGSLLYTRAGQFELDSSGRLIDSATGAFVQAFSGGNLTDIVIDRQRTNPPSPTTKVAFSGNLSVGSTTHQVDQVNVFDADGRQRTLTISFTNNTAVTPGSWLVSVTDSQGAHIGTGEIRFQGSGAPAVGFNSFNLTLTADSGSTTTIALNFGTPGSFDGATSFSAGQTSTLQAGTIDGFGIGRFVDFSFDESGLITVRYSNGQTEAGQSVALANFADPQQLQSRSGNLFETAPGQTAELGTPEEGGLGSIRARSLELANVELSKEFADIIILQRGFQASSQVMNVSSQLIEDVYNSLSGRR